MNQEFKKISNKTETRYILESMTAGATGGSSIATSEKPVGEVQKRNPSLTPRSPVAHAAQKVAKGSGAHKNPAKTIPRKEKHKGREIAESDHEISMAGSELHSIYQDAKQLHAMIKHYSEEGLDAWQQSKITKAADYLNSVLQSLQHEIMGEGDRTMSRAAKGVMKYGKDGMRALAKAGREGASEKQLDAIRDKHDHYNEGWSQKYKNSINCSHPKGFSQRAHCAGKRKHTESIAMEMTCPDCGMCRTHGNLNEIKKGQKDSNGFTKCWPGKHAVGTKKGKNGGQVRNCKPNEGVAEDATPTTGLQSDGKYYNKAGRLVGKWNGRTLVLDPKFEQYHRDEGGFGDEEIEQMRGTFQHRIQKLTAPSEDRIKYVANELEKSDIQAGRPRQSRNEYRELAVQMLSDQQGVAEGWVKNALAGAALVGAGALGGAALQSHGADTHGHDIKKPTVTKVAPTADRKQKNTSDYKLPSQPEIKKPTAAKVAPTADRKQKDTSNYKLPSQPEIDKRMTGGYKLPSQDEIDKRMTGGYKLPPQDEIDKRLTGGYKLPSQPEIDKRLTGGYKLPPQDEIDKRLTGGYKFDPAKAEVSPSTRRYNEAKQGVAEGGPFSYGKPPRKGSVADLAAKRRQEQDRKTPPIEPKDQMVGNAKVTKDTKEGLTQMLRKVDPTIKSRLRSKADRLDDEGDEVHQDLKSMGMEPQDAMTRNMDPEKYYRNADRYRRLADKDVGEAQLDELDRPSGKLFIIVKADNVGATHVFGDFGSFPQDVMHKISKRGTRDKSGAKTKLKIDFLFDDFRSTIQQLRTIFRDVDFVGAEAAEFIIHSSALKSDQGEDVKHLRDYIEAGDDRRMKIYQAPEDDEDDDGETTGGSMLRIDPETGAARKVVGVKPQTQMGGKSTEQPGMTTYRFKDARFAQKLRGMNLGFNIKGDSITVDQKQKQKLLSMLGDRVSDVFANQERFKEDNSYMESLAQQLAEKIPKNAPVSNYIDDFAKAAKTPNAKGHHQFKNKSPEKVRQMAVAASYAAKNPSKKKK